MLEARNLEPGALGERTQSLSSPRYRERRNAIRGSDLIDFENEPLGPARGQRHLGGNAWCHHSWPLTHARCALRCFRSHCSSRLALVIQGLDLPGLIRLVKPQMASGDLRGRAR